MYGVSCGYFFDTINQLGTDYLYDGLKLRKLKNSLRTTKLMTKTIITVENKK